MLKALAHLIRSSKRQSRKQVMGRGGEGEKKKTLTEKKYFCTFVHLFIKYHLK